ncbi:uncharacterized protein LACBIDRAFT_298596 [Laccaria bicolor S238N-H82]|uniref:Predicted protein n=1 Tax=Laccaria bicolor (strain S238N-H82 / ATCC MYA-4686) TaxID=486041 RepID=B0DD67_LACBS|nr:uncharacterized protein LACBIDRAFT_298596 [Laccaria bicolor S238N-H82]EDR07425.1 predicted protein [Laccaria bicolor S238N-H82]|eukprot:XP_001881817.1 predicted protein [Laccaria bicolor S238N-H82]
MMVAAGTTHTALWLECTYLARREYDITTIILFNYHSTFDFYRHTLSQKGFLVGNFTSYSISFPQYFLRFFLRL